MDVEERSSTGLPNQQNPGTCPRGSTYRAECCGEQLAPPFFLRKAHNIHIFQDWDSGSLAWDGHFAPGKEERIWSTELCNGFCIGFSLHSISQSTDCPKYSIGVNTVKE
jgi:hypothetical protein